MMVVNHGIKQMMYDMQKVNPVRMPPAIFW